MFFAAWRGHCDLLKVLFQHGANPEVKDEYGNTALMEASSHGHDKVVELLLQGGAPVNSKDMHGNTALHYASEGRGCGSQKCIDILKKAGEKAGTTCNQKL